MHSSEKLTQIQEKIRNAPDFYETCTSIFYDRLFDQVPGAKNLFSEDFRKTRMFSLMLDVLTKSITDEEALKAHLQQLGQMHRMKGIQMMHLKAGRVAFNDAVSTACPTLEDAELDYFVGLYDEIMGHMNRPA